MVERRRKIHVLGQTPKPVAKPEPKPTDDPAGYSHCPFCGFPQKSELTGVPWTIEFWQEAGMFHCRTCDMAWGRLKNNKIGNMVLPAKQEFGPSPLRGYARQYFIDQHMKKMATKFEKPKFPGPWIVKE